MKRNLIKTLFAIMLVCLLSFTALACNNANQNEPSEPFSLVNFEDQQLQVSYGEHYRLEALAFSNQGERFGAKAIVKDSNLNVVETDGGKFLVTDKAGYTIVYSLKANDKDYSRTVTLTVVNNSKPILMPVFSEIDNEFTATKDDKISTDFIDAVYFSNQGDQDFALYTLPSFTAFDYYDGDITSSIKMDVYKKSQEQGQDDTKLELAINANNQIKLEQAGNYYLLVSVTNSGNVVTEKKIELEVVTDSSVADCIIFGNVGGQPEEVNAQLFAPTSTDYKGISNSDIATNFVSKEGLADFVGNYDGNAVKLEIASNANYRLNFALDNNQYKQLVSEYSYVEIYLATDLPNPLPTGASYFVNDGLIGLANGGNFIFSASKTWQKFLLPIKDFVRLAYGKSYVQAFKIWQNKISDSNIYVGDITFTNLEVLPFKAMESAKSQVGNDNTFSNGVERTFISNQDLLSELTSKNANGSIKNAYQGDVIHVKLNTLYLRLNFNAQTLLAKKSEGYTHLRFNLAFGGSGNDNINRRVFTGLLHSQFTSDANTPYLLKTDFDTEYYVFKSLDVEIDKVIAQMNGDVLYMGQYRNKDNNNNFNLDTYVGDITLEKL